MGLCGNKGPIKANFMNSKYCLELKTLLEKEDFEFYTRQFGKLFDEKNLKKVERNLLRYISKARTFNQIKERYLTGGISSLELNIINEYNSNAKLATDIVVNKDYSFHRAYHILAVIHYIKGNYIKAEEYANEALKWNIFDFDDLYLIINIADIAQNDYTKSENIFYEKIHPFIHMPNDLAKFYINLAKHYYIKNQYELAYACYKYSSFFNTDKDNIEGDANILLNEPQILNNYEYMDNNDVIKILKNNNIPLNISNEMKTALINIYCKSSFIIKALIEKIFFSLNITTEN